MRGEEIEMEGKRASERERERERGIRDPKREIVQRESKGERGRYRVKDY
jgi:hypothetical protein